MQEVILCRTRLRKAPSVVHWRFIYRLWKPYPFLVGWLETAAVCGGVGIRWLFSVKWACTSLCGVHLIFQLLEIIAHNVVRLSNVLNYISFLDAFSTVMICSETILEGGFFIELIFWWPSGFLKIQAFSNTIYLALKLMAISCSFKYPSNVK